MSEAESIQVRAGRAVRDYPVWIEAGSLARVPDLARRSVSAHHFAVISDSNVAALYGAAVTERFDGSATLHTFPAGEASKSRHTWARLTDALLADRRGRDCVIVALGGGVTGDIAGFVAATYMRGIPVIQVPTTILAMVDAAVGGKAGVNVSEGKNLVGAFHPPMAVIVDPACTRTLTPQLRAEGLVEAIKHGAIASSEYFESVDGAADALIAGEVEATARMVRTSVRLKASVVGEDERETGRRAVLNFGHTIGHAIERVSSYGMSHGVAVARGMVVEAAIGECMGVTLAGTRERLQATLDKLGLPPSETFDHHEVLEATRTDKKGRRSEPRYVLLDRIGVALPGEGWTHGVSDSVVLRALEMVL